MSRSFFPTAQFNRFSVRTDGEEITGMPAQRQTWRRRGIDRGRKQLDSRDNCQRNWREKI